MNPGALVADVGHLEHVLVQAGGADGVLKERLVREGSTTGDDDPIQLQFLDLPVMWAMLS